MTIENCPIRGVIGGIGDKWSVLILLYLSKGALRFSAIRRVIPDISQRVLTKTLRKHEREGLIWRQVAPTTPPQVTYGLTDLGHSLIAHLEALAGWAKQNRVKIDAAREKFDAENG